jgi:hypothetical protein
MIQAGQKACWHETGFGMILEQDGCGRLDSVEERGGVRARLRFHADWPIADIVLLAKSHQIRLGGGIDPNFLQCSICEVL